MEEGNATIEHFYQLEVKKEKLDEDCATISTI
jgi:hypothetical protein